MSPSPRRDVREIVREELLMHRRILQALSPGPMTIPELAQAIGCPADEVVFWIMGMRRYGKIREMAGPTDDGYFRYQAMDGQAHE
jgi:predicted Rossmann fold nucleotide-binding protein DprA/Smf involved in DNA uptake